MPSEDYTLQEKLNKEITVHGFVRNSNVAVVFPQELIQICISYYSNLREKWKHVLKKRKRVDYINESLIRCSAT